MAFALRTKMRLSRKREIAKREASVVLNSFERGMRSVLSRTGPWKLNVSRFP